MRPLKAAQISSIAVLLLASSVFLVAVVSASERHSEAKEREHIRAHIHAERERYERPALHSEGTRIDYDRIPDYDDLEHDYRSRDYDYLYEMEDE